MSLPIDIRNYVFGIINDCLNLLQSNIDAAFLRPYLWMFKGNDLKYPEGMKIDVRKTAFIPYELLLA